MATIDLKVKSYDELQFEIMRLITDNHLKQHHIDQLTNNWNELEEWIKIKYKEYSKNKKNHIDVAMSGTFYAVLDKMKEIKEGNNVSSRN